MVLTGISDAWGKVPVFQRCRRRENRTGRHPVFQGKWQAVKQGKNSRRSLPSARKKLPPVGCTGLGRGWNLALFQHAHPARIVAGAGILWHTSAHKGSPLFRRRAPAPNTADPVGFPDGSHERHGLPQTVRKPYASSEY